MTDDELRARLGALAEAGEPRLDDAGRERVLDAVLERGPELVASGIGAEAVRDRLQDLAEEGAPELDEAARGRILDRVEREGPALARPRRARYALVAIPLMAAAAALLLWVATPRQPETPRASCASWSPAEGAPVDGRLSLGRRGAATVDGELSMRAPDGCTTELALGAGRVSVHARELGGGTLRVRAGEVTVEVRGTRFSVQRDGDHVAVQVDEGHVVVRAPEAREIHLHGGERWARGQELAAAGAEPPEPEPAASTVDETVEEIDVPGDAPVAEPAAERSAPPRASEARELLIAAEARWRAGERDRARALFRRVGSGRGTLAEAAWIRLARLELSGGDPERAVRAVRAQRRRFPRSRFGAEALWLEADAERRRGRTQAMEAALERLRRDHPDSPQARAAARGDR